MHSLRLSAVVLGLSIVASSVACSVVGASFDDSATGSTQRSPGDDAISNGDAGAPTATASGDAGRTAGSPLCGDPTPGASCSPDDPRVDSCGNELAPVADAGSDPGAGSSSGAGSDDAPYDVDGGAGPTDEDAGPEAQPKACRVSTAADASTPQNVCEQSGNGGEGSSCAVGTDCGAGLDCVREPGGNEGACRAYCCAGTCTGSTANADEAGRYCDPARRTADESRVPACLPIHTCRLLGLDECAIDQTCAVVRESDGSTGCVEIGTAVVGEACDVEHCALGLTCLGQIGTRTCFQLCSASGSPCPTGQECTWSPPTFREAGLGICSDTTGKHSLQ